MKCGKSLPPHPSCAEMFQCLRIAELMRIRIVALITFTLLRKRIEFLVVRHCHNAYLAY